MKKYHYIFSFIIYFIFFIKSFDALAFQKKSYFVFPFEGKIQINTDISIAIDNNIKRLREFKFLSQNNNETIYKLDNKNVEIRRHIVTYGNKVNIEDHYINKSDRIIGIITNYKFLNFTSANATISGRQNSKEILAENPTILLSSKETSTGIYLNDEFSKINSKIKISKKNEISLYSNNLIIKPQNKYVKSFSIFNFNKKLSYYNFINFLREEFKVFSYIDGNLIWFDTFKHKNIIKEKALLKNLFNNYGVKYLIITPWLDYDNYNHSQNEKWNRSDFKKYLKKIKKVIKNIDPEIKLIAALQSNVINIKETIQNKIRKNKSNVVQMGFHHYDLDIDELLDLGIKKEEIITDHNNKILFETYYHDWKYENKQKLEEIALALKAYDNGHLFYKLIDQINFIIDEVGFDGIYIDQFNQHLISPKHTKSFDMQNVNIADINISSGEILKMGENITLNSYNFKKKIIDFALSKTQNIFFNTHHINDDFRKKPVIRFAEGFWYFWVEKMWKNNSREFFSAKTFFTSHLSTPVALSLGTIQKGDWQLDPHKALVKNLKFCIYNGNLMFFLDQNFLKLDNSKGKINIFKKLYPIKIKEIYSGKIVGEKKIITLVDLSFSAEQIKDYNFFYFDENGYLKEDKVIKLTKNNDKVIIHVEKGDILVLEKK